MRDVPGAAPRATLCLTFDNMGHAMEVGQGKCSAPDPDEPGLAIGYPRLLGLLEQLGLHGTFFIEGWNALHHADRVLELVRRGHEVGVHGWVHEPFASLDRQAAERVLHEAGAAFERIGVKPRGFRAPGGRRGPYAVELLRSLGYAYDSSADHDPGDAIEHQPLEGALEPGWLAPDLAHVPIRYAMADSVQYLRHPVRARTPEELAAAWIAAIDRAADARCNLTLVAHAYVSGVDDARFVALRAVLEHAARLGTIEVLGAGALVAKSLAKSPLQRTSAH